MTVRSVSTMWSCLTYQRLNRADIVLLHVFVSPCLPLVFCGLLSCNRTQNVPPPVNYMWIRDICLKWHSAANSYCIAASCVYETVPYDDLVLNKFLAPRVVEDDFFSSADT